MENTNLVDISKYLSKDVIEVALRAHSDCFEEVVQSYEISPASAPGEGLLSVVYRIRVRGAKHTASFVAKGLVKDLLLRKSLICEKYFKREFFFLTKIVPALAEHQRSTGAKENIEDYLPKCYALHCDGTNDFILMEDFAEIGCGPLSVHLTHNERDMCLKTLAHFHSVSVCLRIQKHEVFKKLAQPLTEMYYSSENKSWYAGYLRNALELNRHVVTERENSEGIYYKKFMAIVSMDIFQELNNLVTNKDSKHLVFGHGDAWFNNFMCSKDKAVTIDFQLVRCCSIAVDLSYFILICCRHCQTKSDYFSAFNVYYMALRYYLQDMGLSGTDVPSKIQLLEEIKQYGRAGFLSALTTIPLLYCSSRCDCSLPFTTIYGDIQSIPLEELWKIRPYATDEEKTKLINMLHVAVDVGLI